MLGALVHLTVPRYTLTGLADHGLVAQVAKAGECGYLYYRPLASKPVAERSRGIGMESGSIRPRFDAVAPAPGANSFAVALDDVSIRFAVKGRPAYEAVAPTSLHVREGEFVALVGPTGCGKSTLLNAAAGLRKPAEGTVSVFGETLEGLNDQAGYLFQQDALMPWKNALDNVAIALEIQGVRRAEARGRARDWMAKVGLTRFGDRYPHQLSGGQRKRVGLAQVLVRQPKILLMDEPFGPLDAQTRQIMGTLLLKLWAQDRKAVLFVTHDLEEAIALSDRVVIMSTGPEARIIGNFAIDLARPRDAVEIRLDPLFHRLHRDIWNQLKAEVAKTYEEPSFGEEGQP
jgi:NitT/TauT family transport system ATP-binding protein